MADDSVPETTKPRLVSDLSIGQRFGRLVLVAIGEPRSRRTVECICDCGVRKTIEAVDLLRHTRSCGCLRREQASSVNRTHGRTKSRAYKTWLCMRRRCEAPRQDGYHLYGGRGIKVCKRWAVSFENFYADMGDPPPGHTIDRHDNDGNYEPGNCRWATPAEQQRKARTTKLSESAVVTIKNALRRGAKQKDLAAQHGVARATISLIASGRTWRGIGDAAPNSIDGAAPG